MSSIQSNTTLPTAQDASHVDARVPSYSEAIRDGDNDSSSLPRQLTVDPLPPTIAPSYPLYARSYLTPNAETLANDAPLPLRSTPDDTTDTRRMPTKIDALALREMGFSAHAGIDRRGITHILDINVPYIRTSANRYISNVHFPSLNDLFTYYYRFQRFLRLNIEQLVHCIHLSIEKGLEAYVNWGRVFEMTWPEYLCHIDMEKILVASAERDMSLGQFFATYIPDLSASHDLTVTYIPAIAPLDPLHSTETFPFPYDPHFPFINLPIYCQHCHVLGCRPAVCPLQDEEMPLDYDLRFFRPDDYMSSDDDEDESDATESEVEFVDDEESNGDHNYTIQRTRDPQHSLP
ncbi:hypothetical protein BDZ89DRAFT_1047204 [Hymenopellis radicata]|nr:hypothetical protein BDZ89DRAFT_1047204 [Hymenopellis radicata]